MTSFFATGLSFFAASLSLNNTKTLNNYHHPIATTTIATYTYTSTTTTTTTTTTTKKTVQVARAQVWYLCQWVEGRTPLVEVAMGETTICASGVFVPTAEGETLYTTVIMHIHCIQYILALVMSLRVCTKHHNVYSETSAE